MLFPTGKVHEGWKISRIIEKCNCMNWLVEKVTVSFGILCLISTKCKMTGLVSTLCVLGRRGERERENVIRNHRSTKGGW
jgi:hypothetical protein